MSVCAVIHTDLGSRGVVVAMAVDRDMVLHPGERNASESSDSEDEETTTIREKGKQIPYRFWVP